jgi:hypothetical protein
MNNSCSQNGRRLSAFKLVTYKPTGKYKTMILPVVLYGCETWSLTLREKCRISVLENRILRRIFEDKREENYEWRKLYLCTFHII